jgi:hypothetical protein
MPMARRYLWWPSAATRSRTHPPYVKRFRAICPGKSTGVPEPLQDLNRVEVESHQRLGRYVVKTYEKEPVRAFLPPALPPAPPLRLDGLQQLLEQANQAVGRLDGLASVLADLSLFIYTYVRKEAVLSSQIEGTQSSLSDLLMF